MTRRRKVIKSLGAAGVAGLAGCGGQGGQEATAGQEGGTTTGSATPERVEFHFLAELTNPEIQKVYKDAFSAWNNSLDDYTITPKFEWVGINGTIRKLNQYIASNQLPHLGVSSPGVSVFHNNLADLTELNNKFNVPKGKGYRETVSGKACAIPHHLEINSKWYRNDVYDAAGVSPPSNWSERVQVAQTLSDHLPDNKYPELVQAGANSTIWNHMGTSFAMEDVGYIERTGPALDDVRVSLGDADQKQKAVGVLKHFKEMYQYSPETVNYSWPDQILPYVNETVMTIPYEGRALNNVYSQSPELASSTRPMKFPESPNADSYKTFAINNAMIVPDSDRASLAKNFIEWMFSSEYYTDIMLSVSPNNVPVQMDMINSDAFKNNEVWSSKPGKAYREYLNENWPDNIYASQNGRTQPQTPYWSALCLDSGIIPGEWSQAIVGRKSPEQAVEDAATKLEEQLPNTLDRL